MQFKLAAASAVLLCASIASAGVASAKTSALDAVVEEVSLTKGDDAGAEDGAETKAETVAVEEKRATGLAANPYAELISSHAAAQGVSEALAHAVVRVESNFRPNATGAAGEIGLMQLKLSTARMMGYSGGAKALYDPETNIRYGMKYLGKAQRLGDGSTCQTILRYNAGHGATRMNPITANYCNKVAGLMQ